MSAYQVPVDPTAVMGKRVAAFAVDWILMWALALGVLFIGHTSIEVPFNPCAVDVDICSSDDLVFVNSGDTTTAYDLNTDASTASFWGFSLLVFVVMQGLTGMTPGKALLGLRTVDENGKVCGIGKAFLRSLVGIVDFLCCSVPIIGGIVASSSKGHRRVGDMAAKTFVISKDLVGQPVVVPGLTMMVSPYAAPANPYGAPANPYPAPGMPSAAPTMPSMPAAEAGPQWDPQRNAYIQWDPNQNSWMQFDDATQTWTPIR